MLKANISFSEDSEELSHSVHRKFYFEPSYDTKLSDEDIVIVPNIPMFGLIKKLKNSDPTEKSVTRCSKITNKIVQLKKFNKLIRRFFDKKTPNQQFFRNWQRKFQKS